MHGYEFQSDFAKYYANAGREEGLKEGQQNLLLKLLGLKFGPLDDELTRRVRAADDDQLERWAERVLTAQTLDDIFASS